MNEVAEKTKAATAQVSLRPPEDVMRLACMGAAFPHRLSFLRVLLRRMKRDGWRFERPVWRLNDDGYGTAVYTAQGPERTYSLVAFSHYLDPAMRTDRVIAVQWDATFALFDGVPDEADLERLSQNVPKQEAGRVSGKELSVARANRSVRMFDHVVERLAEGRQPDEALVNEVGYLMRTTAVYGSGKLGAADFEKICGRPELAAPYQAEMLAVYLIREFTVDLVEHIAAARAPATAVTMATKLRRAFGVGNATGLGMAPYMVNHPVLLNQWVYVREAALARVRDLPSPTPAQQAKFREVLARAAIDAEQWHTEDKVQTERIAGLRADLARLAAHVEQHGLADDHPFDALYRWADAHLGMEARERLVTLLIEVGGTLVDDIERHYHADETGAFPIDGSETVAETLAALRRDYAFAFAYDFADRRETARFWYASAEKLEPRLGERWDEPGAEREQPLGIARDVQALAAALEKFSQDARLAEFLLAHPEHRHMVRRAQIRRGHPWSEVCDNTISAAMRPIDFLRFKLALFGASRFDPKSDRWTRITLFGNAPFARELASEDADDWTLPPLAGA